MEYNGGSVVAMVGKNCVAIASDLRLGSQALTIATNFEKVRGLRRSIAPQLTRRAVRLPPGIPRNRARVPRYGGPRDRHPDTVSTRVPSPRCASVRAG